MKTVLLIVLEGHAYSRPPNAYIWSDVEIFVDNDIDEPFSDDDWELLHDLTTLEPSNSHPTVPKGRGRIVL